MTLRLSPSRLLGLLRKELIQIARDRSVVALAFGLPLLLILMYGYGISMDIDHIPAALLLEEKTPAAMTVRTHFLANRYFDTVLVKNKAEAERLLSERRVEIVVRIPMGFSRDLAQGKGHAALTIYGVDAQSALMFRSYAQGVLSDALRSLSASASAASGGTPAVSVTSRLWFNEANTSTWYLVPGILVMVLALTGSLISSMVIVREHERGTMASVYATPASAFEVLLSKLIPYGVLAMSGFFFCFGLAQLLFRVPVRGSTGMLLATAFLYALWSCALGLFFSAKMKSQFLAIEAAVLVSFMPTMMLSGFLFDLKSIPVWIAAIGRILPPSFAIENFRICYLSGGNETLLWRNLAVLALWSSLVLFGTLRALQKRALPMKLPEKKGGAS